MKPSDGDNQEISDTKKARLLLFQIPHLANEYADWVRVGMACKNVGESLKGDWIAWSRQGASYKDDDDCSHKWDCDISTEGTSSSLTIASMVKWARDANPNWQPNWSNGKPNSVNDNDAIESKTEVFNGFDLIAKFPQLREPIIDGICRRGEIVNLIASPKTGKSWMALSMCLAVSAGEPWLCFPTTKTPVLLIDNELHPEVIASRLMHVAVDMDMKPEQIDILPLRGRGFDIHKIKYALSIIEKGKYGLIVIDSLYRTWPKGTDENSNSDVTSFYNLVDEIADRVNATILLIHHTTKGSQGDRGTTDVGSGAGAISRAADTHLIIRPHSEPDMAVLDAVCRSFPSVDQFTIQFKFPLWSSNADLPPVLAGRNGSDDDEASKERIRGEVLSAINSAPEPLGAYQMAEFVADCSDSLLKSMLAELARDGRIRRLASNGRGGKIAFTYTNAKEDF